MEMMFKKPFTVEKAEEILRRAKLKCSHTNVVFQRGREPDFLEALDPASNAWSYEGICLRCDATASIETSAPICTGCSTRKVQQILRLVVTKQDPISRHGRMFVYTCDKCEKQEEFIFKSCFARSLILS
jgi:hypothetical protein